MNAAAGPDPGRPEEILFSNDNRALLWKVAGGAGSAELAALTLALRAGQGEARGRPVLLVCGGAESLTGLQQARAEQLLGPVVSSAAEVTGAVVADGGTSAGVMSLTGAARARRPQAMPVLLGVAPAPLVSYPGAPPAAVTAGPASGQATGATRGDRRDRAELVPLEHNHSHFLLADTSEWGGETGLLFPAVAAVAGDQPVVMMLAGGGRVAISETLTCVRRGWPVFVIEGTGGAADSVLTLWETHRAPRRSRAGWLLPRRLRPALPPPSSIDDAAMREIISTGDIRPVTGAEPEQVARRVAWDLQDQPVLKAAWQQFATYDRLAVRLRATFSGLQAAVLVLGVLATLLALIDGQVHGRALHWTVVTIPIVAAVLVAVAAHRAVGQRWVVLRDAAEQIRAQIYRYRSMAAGYAQQPASAGHDASQQELAAQLDAIEIQLMQTEASGGPLTPYDGPLPPVAYRQDDDGLSRLDAEKYLRIRVADQLGYYHGRIAGLSRRRNGLQLLAIAAGGAGAILAAAGQEVWIGLTAGMSAAALAYLGYLQIDTTIVSYNQSAARLAALERQWRALGPAQRDAVALADLVTACEATLTAQHAGWVKQMSDALHDLRDSQARSASLIRSADAPAPAAPAAPPGAGDDGRVDRL